MNHPADLLYAKSHEWLRLENGEGVIGITDFAQHSLGDITYVELPAVGATLAAGKELGAVESVKAASDLYSPISGEVVAVNEELADHPELVNQSPYDKGWMVRVRVAGKPEGLLSSTEYDAIAKD